MSQIPLNLASSTDYRRSNFFISDCNKTAIEVIDNWPRAWGISPYLYTLLLSGPTASGKSFLANLWQHNANAVKATDLSNLPEEKNIIVENCENLSEEELFHLFNHTNLQQQYLLLTANDSWQPKLPDLSSRINSVKKINIYPPDDHMMEILILASFSEKSVQINSEIITYLKPRLSRNYQDIKETIAAIDSYCLSHKKKITIPVIKQFFENKISF